MSFTLAELWKSARDEEIVEAVGRWESTNEEAQRALIAEIERRGLDIAVPEVRARSVTMPSEQPNPWNGKVVVLVSVIVAMIFAVAFLVR